MYCSFLWQKDFIDQKIRAGWPSLTMKNYIVYPLRSITDAIDFINKNTPKNAIILTGLTVGNYIPARTGRIVFYGHDNTVKKEEKALLVNKFYQGNMEKEEAYTFLITNGISYVFVGPEEREDGLVKDPQVTYPFLIPVFTNGDTSIYTIASL